MFTKGFWKFFVFILISATLLICLFKILPNKFPEFNFDNQNLAGVFVSILILLSLLYNFLKIHGITSLLTKLLLWQFVFFSIITGYAFRFELQDVSDRILAVLMPSHSWTNKKGQIMIARSSDGHFYTSASINNVNVKFMIDTGASDVALSKKDALKLKYDLKKLNYNRSYATANGISRAASITLSQFKIGDKVFENVKAHVGTGELDISLLGMSVLERFKSFNIDKDILILSY